jgi:hypothetical protein
MPTTFLARAQKRAACHVDRGPHLPRGNGAVVLTPFRRRHLESPLPGAPQAPPADRPAARGVARGLWVWGAPAYLRCPMPVLEAFDRAKPQGKARFVGFTAHKDPAFHLTMLDLGYPFDTVQMPSNPFDASFHSFEKQVLPEVNRRGMAALGMKSMGGTAWAIKNGVV